MPGKRSNPAALRKARLKQAFEDSDPATQQVIRDQGFIGTIKGVFNDALQRRRDRRNPVPDIRGETVIGQRKPRNEA